MPVSSTTPGRSDARDRAPARVAFRRVDSVSTQIKDIFEAQWLAYALPYRRFADVLADACARLGADVVRYSFIAVDLHHLLLAGLPAHRHSSCPPAKMNVVLPAMLLDVVHLPTLDQCRVASLEHVDRAGRIVLTEEGFTCLDVHLAGLCEQEAQYVVTDGAEAGHALQPLTCRNL